MLKIGVSSISTFELPGLAARMLLLGLDGSSEHPDASIVCESPFGKEVHCVGRSEPKELFPGRWFVLSDVKEPLVFLDEVPGRRSGTRA